MKIKLTLNEKQAQTLERALETYTRLMLCQFDIVFSDNIWHYVFCRVWYSRLAWSLWYPRNLKRYIGYSRCPA